MVDLQLTGYPNTEILFPLGQGTAARGRQRGWLQSVAPPRSMREIQNHSPTSQF